MKPLFVVTGYRFSDRNSMLGSGEIFFSAGSVYIRSSIDPTSRSAGALLRSIGRKAKLTSDHHVVKGVWFCMSVTPGMPSLLLALGTD